MFIKMLFNNQGEQTQGECVVRANGPDTELHRINFSTGGNQSHKLLLVIDIDY